MSDIYAGLVPPLPPPSNDVEEIDPLLLITYLQQLTVFHQELIYNMKKASIMPIDGALTAETDETKFSHKLKVRINGVDYFVMLTAT